MKFEGRRGVITVEQQGEKMIATKSAKDASKKGAINKEIHIISYLNQQGISFVPQLTNTGDGYFSYLRILGTHFKSVYKESNASEKMNLVLQLLEKAYHLDEVGVVHGELIRPYTNVLVQDEGNIALIDFERGVMGDISGKNMRSYAQRLLAQGRISLADCKHIGTMERDTIYTYLQKKISTNKNMPTSWSLLLSRVSTLLVLDQLTKYLFYHLQRGKAYLLITPILNTGIGWSIPLPLYFILTFSVGIMGGITRAWKQKYISPSIAILLLAGATGNFIDRCLFHGVRDFIDLQYWPIFNVADMYLSLAVILLFVLSTWRTHE